MNIGFYNYYEIYNNNRMLSDPSVYGGGADVNYPFVLLAKILREKGHNVSTIDTRKLEDYDKIIFADFPEFKKTGLPNKYLRKLIKSKFKEIYLICIETEAIKPNNWVVKNHRYFQKIFTWHDDYVDNKRYVRFSHTSHKRRERVDFEWREKTKLCTLIARNKFSQHPRELYSARRKAIRWWEQNHPEDFDLYGVGWDKYYFEGILRPLNLIDKYLRTLGNSFSRYYGTNNIFHRLAKFNQLFYFLLRGKKVQYPSWRGPVSSIREAFKKYKFAICFENSSFPGWLTERIFSSSLAGCVPIYLGDPNINHRIPVDAFIDIRKFKSYEHLYDYIKNMTDREYLKYIAAMKAFINSEKNYPFTAEYFADTIANEILH